jgi:putative addiction module component (TIGR02574 family)
VLDRELLARVDALPVHEQLELAEHINANLPAATRISKADQALIEARARDTTRATG